MPAWPALFAGNDPWLVLAATLVAGLIRGFAGFGSAMLLAPIFAVLFGSAEMVITVMAIELAVSLQLIPGALGTTRWRTVGPICLAACLAMPLGLWLLTSIDRPALIRLVSAIVVGFVVVLASGWRYRGRRHPAIGAAVGAISGAMMAATGVGGPPVLLYLLAGEDPPAVHRANIIVYFAVTTVPLILLAVASGVVGCTALARGALLAPVMWAGAWTGGRLFGIADAQLYRNAALAVLLCAGGFGLLR